MNTQAQTLWLRLPDTVKQKFYDAVKEDLPLTVEKLMKEININILEFFDLRTMVISTLVADKGLLNKIFLKCGAKEFKFIERSGAYFGFIFGLVQMLVWYFFHPPVRDRKA